MAEHLLWARRHHSFLGARPTAEIPWNPLHAHRSNEGSKHGPRLSHVHHKQPRHSLYEGIAWAAPDGDGRATSHKSRAGANTFFTWSRTTATTSALSKGRTVHPCAPMPIAAGTTICSPYRNAGGRCRAHSTVRSLALSPQERTFRCRPKGVASPLPFECPLSTPSGHWLILA